MTLIYAHRGYSATFPENTMVAFERALALGVAGIELDVHATADGVPVVIHDRDVSRTTNGSGNVDEMSLQYLQTFNAGSGERVPTLASVLDLVQNRVHLDVEVKGRGIERNVLDVLAGHTAARWAISSFDWDTLRSFRRLNRQAVLWPLATSVDAELLAVSAELASPTVSLLCSAYTFESARTLREAGLEVMVWTVNDGPEAQRVRDLEPVMDFERRSLPNDAASG